MAHTLIIRSLAQRDIRTTTTRIARQTGSRSAARWHAGILAKIRTVADHPEMYPLADESADLGIELREALYGRRCHVYRILYTFDGQAVHIHRVRHAAQDRMTEGGIL